MDTCGSPRRQETIGGTLAQTRSKRVLEKPNEPPLSEGHTSGSGEGSMEHTFELMDIVPPTPHDSPLSGGRVESFDDDLDEEDASKQGRESDKTKLMFQDSDFDVLDDDIEDVERETVHTATTGVSAVSAPTLIKIKEEKAKEKGVAIKDVEDSPKPIRSITTLQPLLTIDPKDKDKGVLVEEEPKKPKKVKKKGLKLAELDRAQKERQKQEEATSATLAEEFDEIQVRIDADHKLAVRLTREEQEKYIIKESARLLAAFFERRKKQLAVERYTHQQLKHKNFEEVQKLYEREKKWIDDFKPIDDDSQQQAESTKKRPRVDFKEESSKKQKLEEDTDAEK
ncbi:hypothetical protein Tco_1301187 [Tanacetum coccineum]